MVAQIVASFRRLRAAPYWKSIVSGGVFVLEITHSEDGYHAHIHALVEAIWVSFHALKSDWITCSPGRGVYISVIPPSKAVGYITKYITKTQDIGIDSDAVNKVLKGYRLYQAFGSWLGMLSDYDRLPTPCSECGKVSWMPQDLLYRDSHEWKWVMQAIDFNLQAANSS
jgi:hypothetical protein